MKIRHLAILAIVLAVHAGIAAAEYKYIAAGNNEALWLVRVDTESGKFDLLTRPAGKKWQWVTSKLSGTPKVATTVGGRVMLLLPAPRGYMVFRASNDRPSQGPPAMDERWPGGTAPLAACQANGYGKAEMLAIVARNGGELGGATTKPATRPTTPTTPTISDTGGLKKIVTLSLFGNAAKKWTHLADLKDVRMADNAPVYLAATGETVYVLISDTDQSKLVIIQNDARQEVPIPPGAKPIGMVAIKTGLIIVRESTDENKSKQLDLAIFEDGKFIVKQISDDNKPFAPAKTPIVAQLGDRIAMLWEDGGKFKLATCERTGIIKLQEEVGILDEPAVDKSGLEIIEYFTWGVLIATFLSMLIVRRRTPPKPFTLPPGILTGNLLKRLVAGIIDLLPFFFLAGIIFPMPIKEPILNIKDAMGFVEEYGFPAQMAYSVITAIISYTVYCIVMELRFGATVGKRLMKLRVVCDGGKPVKPANIVMRNVFRIFELIMPPLPLVLLLVTLLTRNRQRLGDIIARTAVVQAGLVPLPPAPPLQEENQQEDSGENDDAPNEQQ